VGASNDERKKFLVGMVTDHNISAGAKTWMTSK
jgi:hypothetical protein